MKSETFTVTLEFVYDAEGIQKLVKVLINGEPGKEVRFIKSNGRTYVGTIGTTIILTRKTGKEADPCAWVYNPTLGTWVWSCWPEGIDSAFPQ